MLDRIKKRKNCFSKIQLSAISLMCVLLVGCGGDKKVNEEAEKIVHVIENNDMESLENLLLGVGEIGTDEELAEFFLTPESETGGIIEKIIAQTSVKVKKVTDKSIVYEIISPELSEIFQDAMKEENLTEVNFEEYIYSYIESAEKTKVEVEVPYTYENDIFIADYSSKEFVDGLTGNMISSYQELIQEMIRENNGEDAE